MLDIPKLGVPLINDAIHRMAQECQDADVFEANLEILETCKALTAKTELKQALNETSRNGIDLVNREKDVQRSLIESVVVRRMR